MAGGGEERAVADFEQDAGCGPDADARRGDQDPGKRVRIKDLLDLFGELGAAAQHIAQASARPGRTVSAAAVPGTTTVCSSRAARMASTSVAPARGA